MTKPTLQEQIAAYLPVINIYKKETSSFRGTPDIEKANEIISLCSSHFKKRVEGSVKDNCTTKTASFLGIKSTTVVELDEVREAIESAFKEGV